MNPMNLLKQLRQWLAASRRRQVAAIAAALAAGGAVAAVVAVLATSGDDDSDTLIVQTTTPSPQATRARSTATPTPARTATASPTPEPVVQRVAYIGTDGDVWIINADGSDNRKLFDVPSESGDTVHNLQWAPDGSKFAVTKSPKDVVYVVSAEEEKLLEVPAVAFLAWSRLGDIFIVARPAALEVEPAILLVDLEGNTIVALPNAFSAQAVQFEFVEPSFSYDGRWLAFFKDVPGEPGGLCGLFRGVLAELEASEVRPIDPNEGDVGCAAPPIFSPRKPSLLAYGNRLFHLDTGQDTPLPGIAVRWSPDGQLLQLYDASGDDVSGCPVLLYDLDSASSVLDFSIDTLPGDPLCWNVIEGASAWSPDGSVMFSVDTFLDKPSVLHIRSTATGEDKAIPGGPGAVKPSPDGRYLLGVNYREDPPGILVVRSDGSNLRELADGREAAWQPQP